MPKEILGGNSSDVKAGFDGLYYFETNLENRPERVCTEPKCVANVDEPFLSCFSWLTKTNSRSELLKKSRWEDFARSCEVLEGKHQIEGMLCTLVTSGPQIDGARFEIAFGIGVGNLPVRVRRLVGDDRRPVAESVRTEFKHFRIDNSSFYFPCKFVTRSLDKTYPIEHVIEVQAGTLRINSSISSELIQLSYDPADFNR